MELETNTCKQQETSTTPNITLEKVVEQNNVEDFILFLQEKNIDLTYKNEKGILIGCVLITNAFNFGANDFVFFLC